MSTPRDLGFALAARALAKGKEAALLEKAPEERRAPVKAVLSLSDDALKARVAALRDSPAAVFDGVHASWLAARLIEADRTEIEAVLRSLDDEIRRKISPELARYGHPVGPPAKRPHPLRLAFDADLVERFRARAFPELSAPFEAPKDKILKFLVAAPEQLETLSRECGMRAVARAFSRIGREDLARLCHGLPAQDSVRFVSMVVELNESMDQDALKKIQATHLRLLKASGISHSLLDDTGLAFLAAARISQVPRGEQERLCIRLPMEVGRRLLDLSAPGALPEESAVEVYRGEIEGWFDELVTNGVLKPPG